MTVVATSGCGCSSVVEHNLAKVGVEGSNPFARSKCPDFKEAAVGGFFSFPARVKHFLNLFIVPVYQTYFMWC